MSGRFYACRTLSELQPRGFAEVCMILWKEHPPVCTVLYWTTHLAAATQAPCWNGRVRRKRGALGRQRQLRVSPRSLTQRHFPASKPHSSRFFLVMRKWIHFWLCPMCFCRAVRTKLTTHCVSSKKTNWTWSPQSNWKVVSITGRVVIYAPGPFSFISKNTLTSSVVKPPSSYHLPSGHSIWMLPKCSFI